MTTQEVLSNCTIEGMVVKMPNIQLDRKEFLKVKTALTKIGGAWKGGKNCGFVFEEDPTELLKEISLGKKRNIKKETQFFPTPKKLADELIKLSEIEAHHSILEPSAGDGAIIKAIQRKIPSKEIDCVEMMPLNRTKLEKLENVNLIGEDFLKLDLKECYDRIIANPPFSKNQDINHVKHMYSMLKSGGRLVSITSFSWFKGVQKKQKDFREWLKDLNAVVFFNDEGSFKESGTNVSTVIIVIEKD